MRIEIPGSTDIMTPEKLARITTYYAHMKARDITDREMVLDDVTQLIEALRHAWTEHYTLRCQLAEAQEKIEAFELGYRGFP